MILRRLAESIRQQDWGTVVIEILVVVVGIFIGLQVDDWNQARQDRRDEQAFLPRLHQDIMLADELSARVRQRRFDYQRWHITAADVLYGRNGRDELTHDECRAIAGSNFFNISVTGLPSFNELAGTGRVGIIRDESLRSALVELQETRRALLHMITVQTSSSSFTHLPSVFPGLVWQVPQFDPESAEIRNIPECKLQAMRDNPEFLVRFSVNIDGFDAYVRDGLKPWSDQFDQVHSLVDAALKISH